MPRYKLTYFNFAGMAERIRLAFKIGGIEFEDERIDHSEWLELKPKTPHGQIPVLSVDGKIQVAQSGAILRYVGRLANMYPIDAEKALEIDEAIGLLEDLWRSIDPSFTIEDAPQKLGHDTDPPEQERIALQARMRANLTANDVPRFLGYFEAKLAKTETGFLCGDAPTIADCDLFATLRTFKCDLLEGVPSSVVDSQPQLAAFYSRIMDIPAVRAYYGGK